MKKKYYYLHTNGELIEKNAYVVESMGVQDYFNSPFVVKYWIATTDKDVKQIEKQADIFRNNPKLAGIHFDENFIDTTNKI